MYLSHNTFKLSQNLLQAKLNEAEVDAGHNLQHALQVTSHASKAIQESLTVISEQSKQDILLASLLHDADDRKYFPLNKNYENAYEILLNCKLEKDRIKKIIEMIDVVSYSKNGDSIAKGYEQWFFYPRYADRIQSIGIKNLTRAYLYGKKIGNPISNQDTPRPKSLEEVTKFMGQRNQDYISRGGTSVSVIDHIFDKLLHIKLPNEITNPYFHSIFSQCWKQLAQFVIKHAETNYCSVQTEILSMLEDKQCN